MADAQQIDAVIRALDRPAPLPRERRTWDRLAGRVAIVTGGARGLGAAVTRLFVAEGAQVIVGDVLDDDAAALVATVGPAATPVHLDVRDEDNWIRVVREAEAQLGPISVLVNNAGTSHVEPIATLSLERYRNVMAVNQEGALLGIKSIVPSMQRAGRGSIVNISSVDGIGAHAGLAPYVSSKFALRGLTRVAALELAPVGIRVNTVHPSVMDTPMFGAEDLSDEFVARIEAQIPLGFIADADDVARVVCFLASDEARYMTGTEVVVDGGVMAKVPLSPA